MAKSIAKKDSKPSAWIVNPKDKGRKSIKSGKVFLNDGDNFEIEIFNPLTVSVLADIKLNNQSISKTGLVIKPGQRVYLDCFIDDRKKFTFKTYDVENSGEVLDAIQKNGLLEVFFYKEDVITLNNWKSRFDRIIVEKWYPYYVSYPSFPPSFPQVWYGTTGGVYSGTGYSGTTFTTNSSNSLVGTTTTSNAYYSSNIGTTTTSYSSNINLSNLNVSGSLSTTPINTSIETGRVEKGEKSKQKFTEVDMDFENNYIHSVIIQILPESRKPAEVKKVKLNIELPKGDWTKEQLEEIKEVVNQYVWEEDSKENKKKMDDNIELIKKLSDLHKSGILTDEEFSSKKAELLSKI